MGLDQSMARVNGNKHRTGVGYEQSSGGSPKKPDEPKRWVKIYTCKTPAAQVWSTLWYQRRRKVQEFWKVEANEDSDHFVLVGSGRVGGWDTAQETDSEGSAVALRSD